MKNIFIALALASFTAAAAGLPGVESKTYTGTNRNGGPCKVIVTPYTVELWEAASGNTYRDFSRRSFEYDAQRDEYVHEDDFFGIETIARLNADGDLGYLVFNEGGYGGLREQFCSLDH